MTDNQFLCAELGIIDSESIQAYSPSILQSEFLTVLCNDFDSSKCRLKLLDIVAKHQTVPQGDWTVPYSFEHIKTMIQIRQARRAGEGKRKACQDELQKILRPAFELVQDVHDEYDSFYGDDLNQRWNLAGEKCNWQGVIQATGRKIALVGSPIWNLLGSNSIFDDGMGIDFPPFYVNGGWRYGWRTITKKELDSL